MSMIGGIGGLGGIIGGPQSTTMTFSNVADLNQELGGLLGSLGIRIPGGQSSNLNRGSQNLQTNNSNNNQHTHTHNNHNHNHSHINNNPFQTPPTNRPQSQQTTQPTSSFLSNLNVPPQPQQPQTQNQNIFNVSNNPILRLNQTITNLNLPA